MRRIVNLLIIFLIYPVSVLPENYTTTCSLGFSFEVSEDKSWGYKEPVIVDITPGSPAERAGLKLNDIILSVNGNGTYLKSHQTVMSWFNLNETSMKIAIRNLEHSFKELNIDKDCRHSNGIRESQLAPVFAFYSLEDVQERRFLMPVKTKTNSEALLHDYRTFAFSPSGENTRELDEQINAIFTRVLTD
ncbi:MAG: PDZ domain-containing protein, partial [Proteiniphilum sp.]|nr:PDZ domain-containing protein [Proteiniphilum sp.]